ncbi:MAG: heparinase II/III family protein, partial [Bryobacteraceae bacterium]
MLRSWPPGKIFSVLDLARAGFNSVRASLYSGDRIAALRQLLHYYRSRATVWYPVPVHRDPAALTRARGVLQNVFDIGLGYPPQQYPADINWNADPVHDIEWVAGMQRFYWQGALLEAYAETRDETYARAWMRLTEDWIRKNPVDPKSFAWLDIQAGLRAANFCAAFERLRTSPALTPRFLAVFLASVYDHGQKSYRYPRRTPHNKAILEANGLCRVAIQFPEFEQSAAWLTRAFEVMELTLGEQLNAEGVQREWTPGYHQLVAGQMIGLIDLCARNHRPAPQTLLAMTRRMFEYWLAMTAPDGYPPMFGDTQRVLTGAWPSAPLSPLLTAARIFERPEFAALAEGRRAALASVHSVAFPKAGMYFFRSGWQPDAVYMALHCSPPAISGHDQPDNGTFELYAHGRWLMPDSGSYAYPDT